MDVLSFGGTKNGLMFGEALLIFNQKLQPDFKYIRKQGMQLHSKMRYIAAQFEAYLTDDLWKKNAQQANAMAQLLAQKFLKLKKSKSPSRCRPMEYLPLCPGKSLNPFVMNIFSTPGIPVKTKCAG